MNDPKNPNEGIASFLAKYFGAFGSPKTEEATHKLADFLNATAIALEGKAADLKAASTSLRAGAVISPTEPEVPRVRGEPWPTEAEIRCMRVVWNVEDVDAPGHGIEGVGMNGSAPTLLTVGTRFKQGIHLTIFDSLLKEPMMLSIHPQSKSEGESLSRVFHAVADQLALAGEQIEPDSSTTVN